MKLNEFLHFNNRCPSCNQPLHLYMQWLDSVCFKAIKQDDEYKFHPFFGNKDNKNIKDEDHMFLLDKGNSVDISFSSSKMVQESKKFLIYFFYLCNPSGIHVQEWGDYQISLYKGCYYRDTPFFEFERSADKKWYLQPSDKSLTNFMGHESYCFKDVKNDYEKVYMVSLDYEKSLTTLWHWGATIEERSKPDFKPNLFEKNMPLLKTRIKAGIEDRDKLISRLDSWILMS